MIEASQAHLRAANALKVAGLLGSSLSAFDRLYRIARDNVTPIETLVGLYAKVSQAQTSLRFVRPTLRLHDGDGAGTAGLRPVGRRILRRAVAVGPGADLGNSPCGGLIRSRGAYPILQVAAAGIKEAGGEVSADGSRQGRKGLFAGVLLRCPCGAPDTD